MLLALVYRHELCHRGAKQQTLYASMTQPSSVPIGGAPLAGAGELCVAPALYFRVSITAAIRSVISATAPVPCRAWCRPRSA